MKCRELNILLFAAFAFFMLCVRNSDVLYTLSEQNLFVPGSNFWSEIVPTAGVMGWIGCWFTQFLHLPWLGTLLLIILWTAIYYAQVRIFHLRGLWTLMALILLGVLLCWLISMGYGVYYMKYPGMAFVPTLYALILVGVLLMLRFLRDMAKRKFAQKKSWVLPFKPFGRVVNTVLFVAFWTALVLVAFHYDYSDENYHHELRMARAMDECRWSDVLTEFDQKDGRPTNLMVLLKNIALQHTGRITDMFLTDNCGTQPYVRDSLTVHLSQQAAPMIYYHVGMFNFAYRWAMENSVQYGLSISNLKMMARCAIWNGEYDLARKYLNLLSKTLFCKGWAAERLRWLYNAGSFQAHPEFKAIALLMSDKPDELDYDQAMCEKYILDYFSDLRTDRPVLEDFALCVSLWTESETDFVEQLDAWLRRHPYEPVPTLYQEAALLISQMNDAPAWLSQLRYDSAVTARFQRFLSDSYALKNRGLSEQDMAAQLRSQYGTTYWWYYYFYTDFQIY